jgi:hypothetical protein
MTHTDAEIDRSTEVAPVAVDEIQRTVQQPVWLRGFRRAGDIWPELEAGDLFLHAGPPLDGREPRSPMLGAITGLLRQRGVDATVDTVRSMVDAGTITLASCHSHAAVGAMAGIVGANTPMVVVETDDGTRGYAPVNEGLGSALRFGDFDPATMEHLRFLTEVVSPALTRAVEAAPAVNITQTQADATRRGDECHNRNVAASSMFATRMAPSIVETNDTEVARATLQELSLNGHFFLAMSMAASKLTADHLQRRNIPGLVTAIASNGYVTGIRVSGLSEWFSRPVAIDVFRPLAGMTVEDADHPVGDSSVTETTGLGAMIITNAPRLARALGWSIRRARQHVTEMQQICATTRTDIQVPATDFEPGPLGIDVHKVLQTGHLPGFTGGFAHREPGRGRVGFGLVRVDRQAFVDAAIAMSAASQGSDGHG